MNNQFNKLGNNSKYNKGFRKKEPAHRINEFIFHKTVRIKGEGITSKICDLQEALNIAGEMGLDLVEISSEANPPVCEIVEYQKFLYEKKRKEKDTRNANKSTLKEIKLGPQTSDHDLSHKIKHAHEFLSDGNKVRVYVQFKHRQMAYKEQGEIILLKFIQSLQEVGKPEFLPKLEGRTMFAILTPKK